MASAGKRHALSQCPRAHFCSVTTCRPGVPPEPTWALRWGRCGHGCQVGPGLSRVATLHHHQHRAFAPARGPMGVSQWPGQGLGAHATHQARATTSPLPTSRVTWKTQVQRRTSGGSQEDNSRPPTHELRGLCVAPGCPAVKPALNLLWPILPELSTCRALAPVAVTSPRQPTGALPAPLYRWGSPSGAGAVTGRVAQRQAAA